ncbi:hypothetical protein [Pseudomonas massiliensis]|uniref:hypothetical protein n=1 Tax=Pseudomonas massiliensis TaxID=522492 RepID=UPI000693AD35|nr:hypothetical protein [Pseudomonas massiliensis]
MSSSTTEVAILDSSGLTEQSQESDPKTCFVIMPIADMDGYEAGHFLRVFEYLVKPAAMTLGYKVVRADNVAASNYIIVDILRKILDSDMVICDLSGRNPNVLYELGVRQAFNLPTVLIKDTVTPSIFDIQGLRYTDYKPSLRIDDVEIEKKKIITAIKETSESKDDVNSIIQLLSVKPATQPIRTELSNDASVILESLRDISNRISSIEALQALDLSEKTIAYQGEINTKLPNGKYKFNGEVFSIGETLLINGKVIGDLKEVLPHSITVATKNGSVRKYSVSSPEFSKISAIPF